MPPSAKKAPAKREVPKDINALVSRINTRYKSNIIVRGDQLAKKTFTRVTTGSLAFDLMLGGGWPLGVWNEIIGQEHNGKTVLVLKTLAANMALDPEYTALWVASEPFVLDWAEQLGVDLARLYLAETNVTEEAYQIMLDFLESQTVDALILDSLPALTAAEEDAKGIEEFTVAINAKLTAKFFRKGRKSGARSLVEQEREFLGIIINQWRDQIGVTYGDPRTTPGGKAKNYSFFTRVEVSRTEFIKDGKIPVGIVMKAQTLKNKTAPARRVAETDFYFDTHGSFHPGEYDLGKINVLLAMQYDVFERKGTWYHFDGEKWNGQEAIIAAAREDIDLQYRIDDAVRHVVLRERGDEVPEEPVASKPAPTKKASIRRPVPG